MFTHIRTKILVLFLVNVVVWFAVLGSFSYWLSSRSMEEQLEDRLKATAVVLASQWDASLLLALKPGMENTALYASFVERLQRMKQQTDLDRIYIASLKHTNILSTERSVRIGQPLPRLDLLARETAQARMGQPSASVLIHVEDRDYKSAVAPVYAQDQVAALLMVDISPSYVAYLQTFRNSLLLFTGVALLCCIFSAHLFSRSITTPISRMLNGVQRISKAAYEEPLVLQGSDELSRLAGAIETMRQNIFQRDMQMKMMLSGIAHEIRNPLAGMELFAGILAKEKLSDSQREYLEKIHGEIQNLKSLLNEFLEYARPKQLLREDFSVSELLSDLETLFSVEIQNRNLEWKASIQNGTETLRADRSKLRQALYNLYKNALQASPQKDGKITTTVHKNGAGIQWEISNTPKEQITQETSGRIFEPFFTTKEKGIGLGLPLARGIIEAHGGELRLIQNDGTRTTFAVRLPHSSPTQKTGEL